MAELTPGSAPRDVAEHRAAVRAAVTPLRPVRVPCRRALGRRLAEPALAPADLPAFDHAAMDGYAVRAADVAGAAPEAPAHLPVAAVVAAGASAGAVAPGSAVRIMTGAPMPPGADAVVPFESTDRGHETVRIDRAVDAGRHVRRRGEDVAAGAVAVAADTLLRPTHVGLLAAVGVREVVVAPRPRVALLVTGAELMAGAGDAAVAESNSALLAAALGDAGVLTSVEVVGDEPRAFRTALRRAVAGADLVVTTGGISEGDRDVVRGCLEAEPGFWFGPVAMKPGRPQGFGVLTSTSGRPVPVVTLPGTPVAAYCSFLLFVREAIAGLAGSAPAPRHGRLAVDVERGPRTVLLPARRDDVGDLVPLPGHIAHAQSLLAQAEVLVVVPPGEGVLRAGDEIEILPCDTEEAL